jgi:hypothetical protein
LPNTTGVFGTNMTTSTNSWTYIVNALSNVVKNNSQTFSQDFFIQLEKEYIFDTLINRMSFGQYFLQRTQIFDTYLMYPTLSDFPNTYEGQKDYIIKNYIN